jgi:hypothetical protein
LYADGHIIRFTPFYFKNGDPCKDKYFIVLKNIEDRVIVASLPTSGRHASTLIEIAHGCVDLPERCFHCFVFEANRKITSNGFFFPLPTFIYANEVDSYEQSTLKENHGKENVDYEIMGRLNEEEYNAIFKCMANNKSIKRGLRKMLS